MSRDPQDAAASPPQRPATAGGEQPPGSAPAVAINPLDEFGPVHVDKGAAIEAYRADAAAGLTLTECARERGVPIPTVWAAARRAGFKFVKVSERSLIPRYRALAARGLTKAEAARDAGVSRQYVSYFAAKYGVEFRAESVKERFAKMAKARAAMAIKRRQAAPTACAPDTNQSRDSNGLHAQQHGETSCQRLGAIATRSDQILPKSCGADQ